MRRKHHKILTFPPEIVEAVNDLLARGATYEEIVLFLREKGLQIGKSSVARYGKEFAARLERIRIVSEQAKAILEETQGKPLQLEEAATQISLGLMTETLLKLRDLEGVDPVGLIKALAHLQSSSVQRERLQRAAERQVRAEMAEKLTDAGKAQGLTEDVIRKIEEQVLGQAA